MSITGTSKWAQRGKLSGASLFQTDSSGGTEKNQLNEDDKNMQQKKEESRRNGKVNVDAAP
jgi:hypothetical protein